MAAADGVAIRSCEGAPPSVSGTPFSEASCAIGYGHFVLIRHDAMAENGERYFTLYAHLDPSTISDVRPWRAKDDTNFSEWRSVTRGSPIGAAGQTGLKVCQAGCIHLHFEVFIGRYFSQPVDPYDISDQANKRERTAYPEFSSLARCGRNLLWATCPRPPTVPRQMQTNRCRRDVRRGECPRKPEH